MLGRDGWGGMTVIDYACDIYIEGIFVYIESNVYVIHAMMRMYIYTSIGSITV